MAQYPRVRYSSKQHGVINEYGSLVIIVALQVPVALHCTAVAAALEAELVPAQICGLQRVARHSPSTVTSLPVIPCAAGDKIREHPLQPASC